MTILNVDGRRYRLGDPTGEGSFWTIPVDGKKIKVEILREVASHPAVLLVRAEESIVRVSVQRRDDQNGYFVELNGMPIVVKLEDEAGLGRAGEAGGLEGPVLVSSPMAGKIASVKVSAGAAVQEGQALIVLEAMKMENEIAAPRKGTVKEVYVQQGSLAKPGDKLVVIE